VEEGAPGNHNPAYSAANICVGRRLAPTCLPGCKEGDDQRGPNRREGWRKEPVNLQRVSESEPPTGENMSAAGAGAGPRGLLALGRGLDTRAVLALMEL